MGSQIFRAAENIARAQNRMASLSGEVGYDTTFHDEWKNLAKQWMNEANDYVTAGGPYVQRSPYASYSAPFIISSITKANPAVVTTTAAHGFTTGDRVLLLNTEDDFTLRTTAANDLGGTLNGHVFNITQITTTTFSLDAVDTTTYLNTCAQGFALKVTTNTAYDPDTDIASIVTELATFKSAVTALDADGSSGDVADAVTRAMDEADTIVDDSYIDDAVSAFMDSIDNKYADGFRKISGGMCEAGAVNSTGYMMAMAKLEGDRRREISSFESKLRLLNAQARLDLVGRLVPEILSLNKYKVEQLKAVMHETGEAMRGKISIKMEEDRINDTIDTKDKLWPLDRYVYGYNAMSAMFGNGGAVPSDEGIYTPNGFGEAMSYASTGAMLGSAVGGPIGAAVGAGAGALVSLFD